MDIQMDNEKEMCEPDTASKTQSLEIMERMETECSGEIPPTTMKTDEATSETEDKREQEDDEEDKPKLEDIREEGDVSTDHEVSEDEGGEFNDDDDEEEEEEDTQPVMSKEDMHAAYNAVKAGDIDLLEDILDKPNSDINMTLYNENLLMTAIRADQQEMAEFLLDNGVDHNFETTLITVNETQRHLIELRKYSCRQMAYDRDMLDIVEIIDYKNNDLFSFIKPRERIPRYRRPKPPTPEPDKSVDQESSDEEFSIIPEDELLDRTTKESTKSLLEDVDGSVMKPKSRRHSNVFQGNSTKIISPNETYECDSGHQSFPSSPAGDSRLFRGTSQFNMDYSCGSASAAFLFRGLDEGYGTMSLKSTPTPSSKHSREKKMLEIPVRTTKSFSSLKRSVHNKQTNYAQIREHNEKPLLWKKVQMCGSYVTESPMWHVDNRDKPTKLEQVSKTTVDRKPGKTKTEPHYARMTTSAYTKRKLCPTFTRAYSDLGFVTKPKLENISVSTCSLSLPDTPSIYTNTRSRNISSVSKEPSRLQSGIAVKGPESRLKIYSIRSSYSKIGHQNERSTEKRKHEFRLASQRQLPQRQRSLISAW